MRRIIGSTCRKMIFEDIGCRLSHTTSLTPISVTLDLSFPSFYAVHPSPAGNLLSGRYDGQHGVHFASTTPLCDSPPAGRTGYIPPPGERQSPNHGPSVPPIATAAWQLSSTALQGKPIQRFRLLFPRSSS